MSDSENWDNGYSILLQSIENQIAETAPSSHSTPLFASSMSGYQSSGIKRSRTDADAFGAPGDSPTSDFANILGSGKKLKVLAELDELKLVCEQMKDRLRRQELNETNTRDELMRQLQFLKSQNDDLKIESQLRLDKYYEEKKKWQSKVRELDGKLKAQKAIALASETSAALSIQSAPASVSSMATSAQAENVTSKLLFLEDQLKRTVEDSRQMTRDKLNLEQQLYACELELRQLRSSGDSQGEAVQEARSLRAQCSRLESTLKVVTREQEQTKKKMKNQTMLEEDLSTCQTKLRIAEETMKAHKSTYEEYRQMKEERKMWNELFHSIMESKSESDILAASNTDESDPAASHANKSVSPAQVLQLLSTSQSRCALLLQGQGQLQQSLSEMRRQLRCSQEKEQEASVLAADLQGKVDRLSRQVQTYGDQKRLYEREIGSLRALLETFDVEFKIGKPELGRIYEAKDSMIGDLRRELDAARALAATRTEQLNDAIRKLEDTETELEKCSASLTSVEMNSRSKDEIIASLQAAAAVVVEDIDHDDDLELLKSNRQLKESLLMADTDLRMLQHFTGIDFIPQKTRVLHLCDNPCVGLVPRSDAALTVPSSAEFQHLQTEIAALKRTMNESNDGNVLNNQSRNSSNHSSNPDQSMIISVLADDQQPQHLAVATTDLATLSAGGPDSSKLNQRLKEMFKERITSFRESVYLLTGFKIDLYSADVGAGQHLPRIRLRSMYAESPEDCLLFQLRGDAPELLETDFATKLDPDTMKYLATYNSVPLFLANITMQLFESQTFMG